MRKIGRMAFIIFLLLLLIYVVSIDSIPDSMILFQGEKLEVNTRLGLNIKQQEKETVEVVSNLETEITKETGKVELQLQLGSIPIKEITVNVIPKSVVIPGGEVIGLKLYTNGVLVVGMSEIEGEDKNKYKPYQNSGIEEGDRIIAVNNETITCTADLVKEVNESKGEQVEIKYVRGEEEKVTSLSPTKTSQSEYKLGLWVRDAAAGVGTVTFYEPESKTFAALGHGIVDVDTGKIVEIARGELVTSNILSIRKGEKGNPGEIRGSIENGKTVGEVYKNTSLGIFGTLKNPSTIGINLNNTVEVLGRNEVKTGPAKIRCTLENGKEAEEYDIEIQKIYTNNQEDNKSMIIKITDEKLLEKTGGIVQGMSGSPIMQDGKFVGAVTHVLVNDPTMGYGVFADMMLKEMKKVE